MSWTGNVLPYTFKLNHSTPSSLSLPRWFNTQITQYTQIINLEEEGKQKQYMLKQLINPNYQHKHHTQNHEIINSNRN